MIMIESHVLMMADSAPAMRSDSEPRDQRHAANQGLENEGDADG
jgi:hypothetical protein